MWLGQAVSKFLFAGQSSTIHSEGGGCGPPFNKSSMDYPLPPVLDNFHPVSNLPFLRKIVEWVAGVQLQRPLDEANYLDPFQSGFKPQHSSATALVALVNCVEVWG